MNKARAEARVPRLREALERVQAKADAGGPRAADYAARCEEYKAELAAIGAMYPDLGDNA